jgi:hypothetical protein
MTNKRKDLTGQRFGRLTALRCVGVNSSGNTIWQVHCDCGTIKEVVSTNLQRNSRSCGCLHRELLRTRRISHGMRKHPAYNVWRGMRKRCQLTRNASYVNYGGRGIKVCRRWQKFENFWADMGATYKSGLSIERKNNAGDYTPHNCVWADAFTQANNRRTNVRIQTPWGSLTVAQAARRSGLDKETIYKRQEQGWSEEDLLRPLWSRKAGYNARKRNEHGQFA